MLSASALSGSFLGCPGCSELLRGTYLHSVREPLADNPAQSLHGAL